MNPSTNVDICNAALYRLGASSISTLNDGTPEANACNLRYDWVRRLILRKHIWKCAMKRASLTANSQNSGNLIIGQQYVIGSIGSSNQGAGDGTFDATGSGATVNTIGLQFVATSTSMTWGDDGGFLYVCPAFDWLFQIPVPSDCLRVFRVNYNTSDTTYALMYEDYRLEQGMVLINDSSINLRYVFDQQNVAVMDSLLIECIALYLAYDLCYKLVQSNDLKSEIKKEFAQLQNDARFVDATEQPAESIDAQAWITARTGLFDGYVTDPMTPQ